MGSLADTVIAALIPIGVVQTGALIYFAGRLTRTVQDHDEALKKQGEQCNSCNRVVAILANKEGIAL